MYAGILKAVLSLSLVFPGSVTDGQRLARDRGSRAWEWRKIASWSLTGDKVPVPANEQVRMNLWLKGGMPPAGNENSVTRIRIDRFSFKARQSQ